MSSPLQTGGCGQTVGIGEGVEDSTTSVGLGLGVLEEGSMLVIVSSGRLVGVGEGNDVGDMVTEGVGDTADFMMPSTIIC